MGSVSHLLLRCSRMEDIWKKMVSWIGVEWTPPGDIVQHLLSFSSLLPVHVTGRRNPKKQELLRLLLWLTLLLAPIVCSESIQASGIQSVVAPGDIVHVIGEFDALGKCDVNREKIFLIVHPDILVSGTRVSASFSCPRPTILDERLNHREHSAATLMGTLLHQIFQAVSSVTSPQKNS
ncbi:hypothetical protein OROMI_023588 [Orobanche minor]